MITSTSILIRVQARGGKFLGPDIGYSFVTVRDVATGSLLAHSSAVGDSGQISPTLGPNVSNGVVFSASQTPNWLSATAGSPSPTAGFLATFDLDAPALLEIAAAGTPNGTPNQHTTAVRMWVCPGAQLTTEPGLVLQLPGLNVQILEPNPAAPPAAGQPIRIRAWVTMMCGCKIVDGGDWPTDQFQVTASLVGSTGTVVLTTTTQLAIEIENGSEVPSLFTGTLPYPSTSGEYRLIVSAIQPSTSNSGGSELLLSL